MQPNFKCYTSELEFFISKSIDDLGRDVYTAISNPYEGNYIKYIFHTYPKKGIKSCNLYVRPVQNGNFVAEDFFFYLITKQVRSDLWIEINRLYFQ